MSLAAWISAAGLNVSKEDLPWSYMSLVRLKSAYEDGGFIFDVLESRPPMEKIKLGLPGRDEQIDAVCDLIRNLGSLGIRSGATSGCRSSTGCAPPRRRPLAAARWRPASISSCCATPR